MTQTETLLILLGGMFVIEALSVAIQVLTFQLFHKRVFAMAPIHHHFEMKGWSETKIILRLWIVAAVCAAIGFVIFQSSLHSLSPSPSARVVPTRSGVCAPARAASACETATVGAPIQASARSGSTAWAGASR